MNYLEESGKLCLPKEIINEGLFNKNNNHKDIIKQYKNDFHKTDNDYFSKYKYKLKSEVDSKLKNMPGYKSYVSLNKDEINVIVSVDYKAGNKLASALNNLKIGTGFYNNNYGILLYDDNIILFNNGAEYIDDNNAQTMDTDITFKFIYTKEDEKYSNIKVSDLYNIIKINGKIDLSYPHHPIRRCTKGYVSILIDEDKLDKIISSFKKYEIQKELFNIVYIFNPSIIKTTNESYIPKVKSIKMNAINNLSNIAESCNIEKSHRLRDNIVAEYTTIINLLDSIDNSIIKENIESLPVYKIKEGYAIDLSSLKYIIKSEQCTLEEAIQKIRSINHITDSSCLYCVLPEDINEKITVESFITLNESLNKSGIIPAISKKSK